MMVISFLLNYTLKGVFFVTKARVLQPLVWDVLSSSVVYKTQYHVLFIVCFLGVVMMFSSRW